MVRCICRNRKDNGNPTLVAQIARHFNLPAPTGSSNAATEDLFKQFIYLTQVSSHGHALTGTVYHYAGCTDRIYLTSCKRLSEVAPCYGSGH